MVEFVKKPEDEISEYLAELDGVGNEISEFLETQCSKFSNTVNVIFFFEMLKDVSQKNLDYQKDLMKKKSSRKERKEFDDMIETFKKYTIMTKTEVKNDGK